MKTWVTADWHLGEDRLELLGRPHPNQSEHVFAIRNNFNALVKPEDRVIMLGDVCYQKTPEFLHYVSQFNGHKILVRGNHDRVFTDEQLKPYFEEIVPEGDGFEEIVGGVPCYFTHYPSLARESFFNIVGHIHGAWKYQLNSLNIGVDVHHFRPVDLEKIPFYLNAITNFYDEDVWVAYHAANQSYRQARGKKGTYFSPTAQ